MNTHLSSGTRSVSEKRRKRYFNLSDAHQFGILNEDERELKDEQNTHVSAVKKL